MKTTTLGVALILSCFASLATVGCAAEPAETGSSEQMLVQQTRLDRVMPAEVAKIFAARVKPNFERCISGRPEITEITPATIHGFYQFGSTSYWDVKGVLESMLEEPGVTAIPVASLLGEIEPWATRTLSKHVDADGFYTPPTGGVMSFYYDEVTAREEKAFSLAARPGGKDLREIRAHWREVQQVQDNLDSAWLNPVKVSGDDPDLNEIRKAMQMPFGMEFVSWGNDASDDFYTASEGPAEAYEFEPIAEFVKSSAIKKRWYFQGGGDEWSRNFLVVLDDQNQLWGMMMGYTE